MNLPTIPEIMGAFLNVVNAVLAIFKIDPVVPNEDITAKLDEWWNTLTKKD